MTLDQLRIFIAVAEREHITRAAEALHMTQSAVSAAIAALESRHAVALFDRVGRVIVLNDAGRSFLAEARGVLDRARAAQSVLNDLSGLRRGRLSVMASQTVASHWLPPRLARFRRDYPQIEMDVRFSNTNLVADGVENGEVELGLVEGQVSRPALTTELLEKDEMIVVVGPSHPWADGTPVRPADLVTAEWVAREPGSGTRAALDQMLDNAGGGGTVVLALPDNEALIGVVEAGLGATLVSRHVVRAHLAAGLIRLANAPPVQRSFFLLRHRERHRTRAAEAFLKLLWS